MNKKIFLTTTFLVISLFLVSGVNAFWANYSVLSPPDFYLVGENNGVSNHPEFFNLTHFLFNYTVITNETYPVVNVSFYSNIGDPWGLRGTNNVDNATDVNNINDFQIDALSTGNYTWNFLLQSNESETVWIAPNRTFYYVAEQPGININFPAEGLVTNAQKINFNWSYVEVPDMTGNCTILINGIINQTVLGFDGQTSNYTLVFETDQQETLWLVNCTNGATYNEMDGGNFSIDTLSPAINFSANTGNGSYSQGWFVFNVTSYDLNPDYVNLSIFYLNESRYAVQQINPSQSSYNFTNIPNGTYYFNATAYDLASNENSTNTFVFFSDPIIPAISYSADAQAGDVFVLENSVYVNVTIDEEHFSYINFTIYNRTGIVAWNESGETFHNFTGLKNVTYFFNATVYDLAGNMNTTVVRNASIGSSPFTNAFIGRSPDDGINYGFREYQFNISWNDSYCGVDKAFMNINGTDYGMTDLSGKMNWSITFSNFSAGIRRYYFWANNTCGYVNSTTSWTYQVNKTIQYLNLTVSPSTIYYSTSITVNGTGCIGQLSCSLLRNGSVITNPQYGVLGVGLYNFTYKYSANENFTAFSNTSIIRVLDVVVGGSSSTGLPSGTTTVNNTPVTLGDRQFLKNCGESDSYFVGYVDFCTSCRNGNLVLENNTYNCYTCKDGFNETSLSCITVEEQSILSSIPKPNNENMIYYIIGAVVLVGGLYIYGKKQ